MPATTARSGSTGGHDAFIQQFDETDRPLAETLVSAIQQVSAEDLETELLRHVSEIAALRERRNTRERGRRAAVLALYVERELEGGRTRAPIFQPVKKRAVEPKVVPLVHPVRGRTAVGSEGPIARIASSISAANPSRIILSPGPERIRTKKVRHVVLLTDVIASGTRIERMLSAFYAVGSVRSWLRARWIKFHVVALAATDSGVARLRRHSTRPQVHQSRTLPTIATEFVGSGRTGREAIEALCRKYDPMPFDDDALGYGSVGALMTVAGRCPNNAPRLLHGASRKWIPLFPNFVAKGGSSPRVETLDRMTRLLVAFGEAEIGQGPGLSLIWSDARPVVLLLVGVARGYRSVPRLAAIAGTSHLDAARLIELAHENTWIDGANRLTAKGETLLERLRTLRPVRRALPEAESIVYIPGVLREPKLTPSSPWRTR
jgi:hypothetical protein